MVDDETNSSLDKWLKRVGKGKTFDLQNARAFIDELGFDQTELGKALEWFEEEGFSDAAKGVQAHEEAQTLHHLKMIELEELANTDQVTEFTNLTDEQRRNIKHAKLMKVFISVLSGLAGAKLEPGDESIVRGVGVATLKKGMQKDPKAQGRYNDIKGKKQERDFAFMLEHLVQSIRRNYKIAYSKVKRLDNTTTAEAFETALAEQLSTMDVGEDYTEKRKAEVDISAALQEAKPDIYDAKTGRANPLWRLLLVIENKYITPADNVRLSSVFKKTNALQEVIHANPEIIRHAKQSIGPYATHALFVMGVPQNPDENQKEAAHNAIQTPERRTKNVIRRRQRKKLIFDRKPTTTMLDKLTLQKVLKRITKEGLVPGQDKVMYVNDQRVVAKALTQKTDWVEDFENQDKDGEIHPKLPEWKVRKKSLFHYERK